MKCNKCHHYDFGEKKKLWMVSVKSIVNNKAKVFSYYFNVDFNCVDFHLRIYFGTV